MSPPDYTTNDPKGWCGDPKRGAAMGRATIIDVDPETFDGQLYVTKVRMGGDYGDDYDYLGTYFGANLDNIGDIYWVAAENLKVDFVVRAQNREHAEQLVLEQLPKARFFR